ncbi:phage tail sheath subtilisin-like domain-containing protein [Humitalea sp. 24SJ18S-53]|uniref:phage tail sheath subtilisin-like domain-containing protein n=1 Tax=Humitalea sp. 24SJ18S-53 TaxID=3422307 RepID=UPI003D675CD5
MTVPFNLIPIDTRTPGVYIEADNSRAANGANIIPTRVLVMGQMLAGGTATPLTPQVCTSAVQAAARYGRGSQLALMLEAFKRGSDTVEVWGIGVVDAGASVAAAGQALVAGTATAAAPANLMVAGRRYRFAAAAGATAASIAAGLVAAINADLDAPFTAANVTVPARVDITARNKGVNGNDFDIRGVYYDDDAQPPGITVTVTPMAAGATNPVISTVFTALGDMWFTDFVVPWNDTANLLLLQDELVARFGPMRQQDCHAWRALSDTLNNLLTAGGNRNCPHISVPGWFGSPSPPPVVAATLAAVSCRSLTNSPSRPVQTLVLPGILPPPLKDRFKRAERDLLLHRGISTLVVDSGGTVSIDRVVTEYRETTTGIADTSYLNVETLKTVTYLRYDTRALFATKYPRHMLAEDGTQFGLGLPVMTPKLAKAELIARFALWEEMGLVQNRADFIANLLVERSLTDRDRLDALIPPTCMNQFRVLAALFQFRT